MAAKGWVRPNKKFLSLPHGCRSPHTLSFAAFPSTTAETWIRSGTFQTQNRFQNCRQCLTCYATMLAPAVILFSSTSKTEGQRTRFESEQRGASFRSHTWLAGAQVLGPSSPTFAGILAESWIRVWTPGLKSVFWMEMQCWKWWFNLLFHIVGPSLGIWSVTKLLIFFF